MQGKFYELPLVLLILVFAQYIHVEKKPQTTSKQMLGHFMAR